MSKANSDSGVRFITIEGGEGAGKSTVIERLTQTLSSLGYEVIKTREPGGTPLGEHVRNWLLNHNEAIKISDKAELLLFLSARSQHIEELIQPSLKANKIVICDRYNDSTVAYQGAGRGLGVTWVRQLCNLICGTVLPDLTFFLDVDPVIGLQRTRQASKENAVTGQVDRIESEKQEFHERVRAAFQGFAAAEPHRFCVVDASQAKEKVIDQVLKELEKRLKLST